MENRRQKNVIVIGAGIMSATFATILKKLEPKWHIKLFEKLDDAGKESSYEWNNAGTGHEAFCELNYTVENEDGLIDTNKAVEINEQFQMSKQFWSYLVNEHNIHSPETFIRTLPHISFVHGEDNIDFLRRRYYAMSSHPMFKDMEYSENHNELAEWLPLMMEGRSKSERVAATKVQAGTDVNFGELTRKMVAYLEKQNQTEVRYHHDVLDIKQLKGGTWEVKVRNYLDDTLEYHTADFVFIGAGGGAIPLLQKTKIPESKQIGGFPISGQFLVCTSPEIVNKHQAKVYSKEPAGTPPMTVPHLDRRSVEGKEILLFGPFASFGPKFLKNGSNLDLLRSVKLNNLLTMIAAGAKNIPLIKYSIHQILLSKKDQLKILRTFIPDAKDEDWELIVAGKRVQVIKDTDHSGRGVIQFGTEIVQSEDHSLAALLGESPGASTSVAIILDVLQNNFPHYMDTWEPKIKEMIPSFAESLANDAALLTSVRELSTRSLGL